MTALVVLTKYHSNVLARDIGNVESEDIYWLKINV